MSVPTNEELEAIGPDNARDAIAIWLLRHVRPLGGGFWSKDGLKWAANNMVVDPQVKKFILE